MQASQVSATPTPHTRKVETASEMASRVIHKEKLSIA